MSTPPIGHLKIHISLQLFIHGYKRNSDDVHDHDVAYTWGRVWWRQTHSVVVTWCSLSAVAYLSLAKLFSGTSSKYGLDVNRVVTSLCENLILGYYKHSSEPQVRTHAPRGNTHFMLSSSLDSTPQSLYACVFH